MQGIFESGNLREKTLSGMDRGGHIKMRYKAITQNWFDRWSNEYDQSLGKMDFHRELLDLIVNTSGVSDKAKVLDMGCGTGLLSLKFLQKADCSITGIDNSREMLVIFKDKIIRLGLENKVHARLMDIEKVRFKKSSFDFAASSVVLHHLKNKLAPLKKIYRFLKPGGVFMIGEIDMDTEGSHTDINRLKRVLRVLEQEWVSALKDAGIKAFAQMYNNGLKHILNQGEYCVSLKQWAEICKKAGFSPVTIKRLPRYKYFGIVVAKKPIK